MTPEPIKIYLATPYTDKSEYIRNVRACAVTNAFVHLVEQGFVVFSPITMCHPVADVLPHDWEFWRRKDEVFLSWADALVVLCLDGWETSKGVQAEIKRARELNKPVYLMHALTYEVQIHWRPALSVEPLGGLA